MRAAWARRSRSPPVRRGHLPGQGRRHRGTRVPGDGGKGDSGSSEGLQTLRGGDRGSAAVARPLRGPSMPSRPRRVWEAGAGYKQKGLGRRAGSSPLPSLPPETKLWSGPDLSSAPRAQTARFPERKVLGSWGFFAK